MSFLLDALSQLLPFHSMEQVDLIHCHSYYHLAAFPEDRLNSDRHLLHLPWPSLLDVSPHALDVPDIDSYIGLMHTLFTLEDLYGLTVSEADGEVCLKVNKDKGKDAHELLKMLYAWKEQADKLSSEEISKEEYDNWRYRYPKFDTTQRWAKVPSQELSDALVEMFKDQLKPDK